MGNLLHRGVSELAAQLDAFSREHAADGNFAAVTPL
jgi:hypothetical protein